ncbi:MAG: hypothetical protein A3E83_09185 [Gammaproteobacteria bacterium RIFCSPHIGHO2_12_FULL_41_20]|nr:MAG: hypothetical protein A3E83_09185 [Gammaproteobacteria bacterium RIFCSPHIGHO2_12_FULL_41_20]
MKHTVHFIIAIAVILAGCTMDHTVYAPVTEVAGIEPIPKNGMHKVVAGESLYEIAWRYGLDYRVLLQWNYLPPPYRVYVGEAIYLRPQPQRMVVTKKMVPSVKPTPRAVMVSTKRIKNRYYDKEPTGPVSQWGWPARGKVTRLSKGIDIAGEVGQPILAAANGKVVYAGNGLRAYGNLILIKHNNLYLSAYAYNRTLYVQEGGLVKKGQKIANMGNAAPNKAVLHFEIRRAGKSVNPLSYLPLNFYKENRV